MIDANIYTNRWWFHFATHSYDGFHLWLKPDMICRLAFVTIGIGRRNKQTTKECFDLDKKLNRRYS